MYFIIRVTASQEKITADILQNKISKTSSPIFSIIMPYGMRGYIIIEAENEIVTRELILNEPHVKGMLSAPLTEDDLNKMLAAKQQVQEISINDVVEFFGGPLKGYKARVIKVDSAKEEITVMVIDSAVPIPTTTKSNLARIIEHAKEA